jgi:hypothetical protein
MKPKLKLTTAQKKFFRTYRQTPGGPVTADWPSPLVFRRWLKRPAFRAALESLRDALRFQADFHLAHASASAARSFMNPDAPLEPKRHLDLLHLSHTRQRFAQEHPESKTPAPDQKIEPKPEVFDPDAEYNVRARDLLLTHWNKSMQDGDYLRKWIYDTAVAFNPPGFIDLLAAWPDLQEEVRQSHADQQARAEQGNAQRDCEKGQGDTD